MTSVAENESSGLISSQNVGVRVVIRSFKSIMLFFSALDKLGETPNNKKPMRALGKHFLAA